MKIGSGNGFSINNCIACIIVSVIRYRRLSSAWRVTRMRNGRSALEILTAKLGAGYF